MSNRHSPDPMTQADYLSQLEPRNNSYPTRYADDEWLDVCDRCPLFDCVRPEGMYSAGLWGNDNAEARKCPIYRAWKMKLTPAQALDDKAGVLGLLDEQII